MHGDALVTEGRRADRTRSGRIPSFLSARRDRVAWGPRHEGPRLHPRGGGGGGGGGGGAGPCRCAVVRAEVGRGAVDAPRVPLRPLVLPVPRRHIRWPPFFESAVLSLGKPALGVFLGYFGLMLLWSSARPLS